MNLIELSEFEFLLEQPNPTFLWTSFSYTTAQPNLTSFCPGPARPINTYTSQDEPGMGFQWLFENGNGTTNLVPSQVWDEDGK